MDVKLHYGWLSYLGAIFSDNGAVYLDVDSHVREGEKSVYIKLANYIHNNPAVPIVVKKKVLSSCLNASLLYGCEAWGGTSLRRKY